MYEENVEWIFNEDCRDKKKTGNGIHGRAARLRKHESVKMPSEQEPDKFQRRLILGAGPCFTTTLRELKLVELLEKIRNGEWITVQDLKALPFEDGQKVYAEIRRLHTTAEMYQGFSCSSAQISELSWLFQVARSGKQILVGEPALDVLRGFTEHRQNQAKGKRESKDNDKAKEKKNGTEDKPKRKYKPRQKPEEQNQLQTIVETMYEEKEVPEMQEIEPNGVTLVEIKKPEIDLLRISVKNVYSAEQIMAFLTRIQLFCEGQDNLFELSLTLQEKVAN